jgi:phage tail-like protein
MRLQRLMATPHPAGHRIDLRWENPAPNQYPGVRVVRREGTHPTTPNDGVLVAEGEGLEAAVDHGLKGETVYYYTLFLYQGNPAEYHFDSHNRTAAMATAPYNLAGQMHDLLPGIYHRYDEDTQRGQLRRFLDLPGGQLDQFYSFAKALLDLYNLDKADGRFLPLLAYWIGWQTDYRLEIAAQRNEIGYAPYLYQTIGLIPTLEATVKRLIGWESRTKEFVHNVLRTNCPERLNLWLRQRSSGVWSHPTAPLSLNFAYEGRPATVRNADGLLWLFYHTFKRGRWEIWYKTYHAGQGWTPSQPLTRGGRLDKHPAAALQGATLWVFWSSYTESDKRWRLHYRTRTGTSWSAIQTFANDTVDRQQPCAVADASGGLWLFWLEREDGRWQLKYNRHNGTAWQLATAASFPLAAGQEPRVESDLFVLFHPTDTGQRIWVFWARQEPAGVADQKRWHIAYRVKQGLDPNVTTDWSNVRALPQAAADDEDREPATLVNDDGNIELFWSSTRDGSWSIWRATLNAAAHTWGIAEQVTLDPYTQRTPLPIAEATDTWLIYRSNESLSYPSSVYGATETTDFRYAGCTTVDSRNLARIALHGQFEDFQTYTYDAGVQGQRTDADWYARDTVGLYLIPTTEDPQLILRNQNLVQNILRQFLPIQVRAVFIIEPVVYKEPIYTYDFPTVDPQRQIGELFFDRASVEVYSGLRDHATDSIPGWIWMRSWSTTTSQARTVDVTVTPVDTRFRTWQLGVEAGG